LIFSYFVEFKSSRNALVELKLLEMLNSTFLIVNRNIFSCFVSRRALLCSKVKIPNGNSFSQTLSIYPQSEVSNEKVVNVAIVGVPNSGKSTLINNLVDRKVCATSNKVHTTTNLAKAICTEENVQIIFLDTPGIVSTREQKQYKLHSKMTTAPSVSLRKADIVGVIMDVANKWTKGRISPLILDILEKNQEIPSFLILNKIDLLKSKRELLDLVQILSNGIVAGKPIVKGLTSRRCNNKNGYSRFSDVFMVSALEGDGIEKIKKYLMKSAKPGKWAYSEEDWTDQTRETLIVETVRAKFLDFLHQEIPYKLVTEIEYLEDKRDSDKLVCLVCVTCPTERIEKLIAGAGGGKLRQITDAARHDLVQMFHRPVSLTISLRVDTEIKE